MEAEFLRRISEVQAEFPEGISDLQAEFCRKISAPEGGSGSTATLPSKAKQGQKERSMVSRGAKKRIGRQEEDAKRGKVLLREEYLQCIRGGGGVRSHHGIGQGEEGGDRRRFPVPW